MNGKDKNERVKAKSKADNWLEKGYRPSVQLAYGERGLGEKGMVDIR